MQPDLSIQKLDQMDRAIIALKQQFPTTEYYHETLVISEEEAHEISQIIAAEPPGPSNLPHLRSHHSQDLEGNVDLDFSSTDITDQDTENEDDNESVYSTTSHPSITRNLGPLRKKLAKYILKSIPITTRLLKTLLRSEDIFLQNIEPLRRLLNNQQMAEDLDPYRVRDMLYLMDYS